MPWMLHATMCTHLWTNIVAPNNKRTMIEQYSGVFPVHVLGVPVCVCADVCALSSQRPSIINSLQYIRVPHRI